LSQKYFLGPLIANGIVSYTTYKGDMEGFQLNPNAVVVEYEGLQMQREFYSPAYEQKADQQPHARFQESFILVTGNKTDERGKNKFFLQFRSAGKYMVVIQELRQKERQAATHLH